jgi:amidase
MCNAMDYACTVFPVTFVSPELDVPQPLQEFHSRQDEAIYKLCTLFYFTLAP